MMKQIKKIGGVFLLIILVSIGIRVFVGEPCHISSGSMEPTLVAGDWLWINKLTYGALLPAQWADIPLVNILTWSRAFRKHDSRNNWGYHRMKGIEKPQIGDIVVFHSPEQQETLLIKRIAEIVHKGSTIYPDSINMDRYRALFQQERSFRTGGERVTAYGEPLRLQNSYYFVLGDHTAISRDSRFFGYVSERDIVGKVNRVIFSMGESDHRVMKKVK